ncbi:DUF2955 domain-containing protein [Tropicimonas isoalkanivorans]|uniref:DUF2955 domain-containing protein n=1 Tax=Tropicimonas isoalkanivorans TaxID=441112 RepID=A0A1I1IMG2_9RHOB|nr:DUF2955 domain-containing protein [Tropicimonas isoalkanivorans]SFC37426.1 Protein of unknown function [Tropicimonas isoalkanivorans]
MALRLALGPAALFVLGMAYAWPLAFVAAVLSILLLQAPAPPSLRAGGALVATAAGLMLAAWVVFTVLQWFPALYMVAVALWVVGAFNLSVNGRSPLLVVLSLFAGLLIPLLVKTSPQLALLVAAWLPLNLAIAVFATQAMFVVLPASQRTRAKAAGTASGQPAFDPERRLVRMSLVTLPYVLVFFLTDGGAVLTLLIVALLTQQLAASTLAGPKVAGSMLVSNVIGGLAALVCYELVVMAPFFPFMALVTLLACLVLGTWSASGRQDAALAGSAMSTMLILFGGAMAPFAEDTSVAMGTRLLQVGMALAWVLSAFVVVDVLLPERSRALPNWRNSLRRGRGRAARAPGPPG